MGAGKGGGGRRWLAAFQAAALLGGILVPALVVGPVTATHPTGTPPRPTGTATLTVTKVCVPDTDLGAFQLRIDGKTKASVTCPAGGTTPAITVKAGLHKVSEAATGTTKLADYAAVITGDCAANGSITLAAGDVKTCTITNTRKAQYTLTVTKICVPDTDPGTFNLRIDARTVGTVGCSTVPQSVAILMKAGTHKVSETAGSGTTLSGYAAVIGGACAADGSITLTADATCTITNTRRAQHTLTVQKVCAPDSDPGLFNLQVDRKTIGTVGCYGLGAHGTYDWEVNGDYINGWWWLRDVAGANTATWTFLGHPASAQITFSIDVLATSYASGPPDIDARFWLTYGPIVGGAPGAPIGSPQLLILDNPWTTGDPLPGYSTSGSFTVAASDVAGADGIWVTIGRRLGPGNGVVSEHIAVNASSVRVVQSVAILLNDGIHKVGETAGTGTTLSGYAAVIGGACAADGTIALAADAICTITNTRLPFATLTLTKVCVPDPDPGLFDLLIDGRKYGIDDVSCESGGNRTTGPVAVGVGLHRISETADGTTKLTDYTATFGGACAADGTVTLTAGQVAVCTITNARKATTATLTVAKVCDPTDDGGHFNLLIDGDRVGTEIRCGGTSGAIALSVGTHTVSEIGGGGGAVTNHTGTGISFPYGIAVGPDGALWFANVGNDSIGRVTVGGAVTNYTGTGISSPYGIVAGPDGALWFTNFGSHSIGRITTGGAVTNYTGIGIISPYGIAAGPDGALWFANVGNDSIGRITTAGVVTKFTGPGISIPVGIEVGSDGALWFTNFGSNSIGRITIAGSVTNYTDPSISNPHGIAAGPDGALWFTNHGNASIGRITTGGAVTNYTGPGISSPWAIATGPDGALWFTIGSSSSIGRITTAGVVTNYTDPSISGPAYSAAGPDGALWFTSAWNDSIGRIGTDLAGYSALIGDGAADGTITLTAGQIATCTITNTRLPSP